MKKRSITAVFLTVALMVSSLVGCGNTNETQSDIAISAEGSYSIGIVQLVQHPALDAATEGFIDAVTATLGVENIIFDLQNASGDSATCATIVNQFVANDVDLIMANATTALQAAMSSTEIIPIVATSITDYATALDIDNWTGKTGINVTGTSDLAPLKEQAEMILELVPDVKTVGILYCSSEANSKYQATQMAAYLDEMGISSKEYTSADSNDIALVTESAIEEVDVLFIPTDNTMASNTEIINSKAEAAKIPVFAGEEGICKGCGIATLSIDYYSIGYKAGEMAADILANGSNPADMEIEFATDLTKKYMVERSELLEITIPDTYVAIEEN